METNSDKNMDRWVEDRLAALAPNNDWQPDTRRGLARFREQREKASSRKRRLGWLIVSAVAAGLPIMAFPTTRVFAQRCVSACVSQTGWVRNLFAGNISSSAPSTVYMKPENRKMAPDFVLDDASGKAVKLSEFHGKVVLLNFWATWCAPCNLEIPWFIEFQNTHQDSGFTTLGVSLDEDGWDAVRPYIDQRKVNYRVMVGNDNLAQLYGAASLPTTFIIDKSGRIAATHVGLCSKGEYEADIRAVLNEQ
jgi:cytochrome c biogenesis protein CcmG/thiol:disulfide interchange protein DsbE